jgi:hypothetical protein
MSIKVLDLVKNSEIGDLSIDMQEGVGGGEYSVYQAGLEAYAGGGANISYRGGDIIEINSIVDGDLDTLRKLNTLSPYGQAFNQGYFRATFSVKGDTVILVNSINRDISS